MEEENIKRILRYLTFSQSECDETKSFTDKEIYDKLKERYTGLSKQINKFIAWVDRTWNNFPSDNTNQY